MSNLKSSYFHLGVAALLGITSIVLAANNYYAAAFFVFVSTVVAFIIIPLVKLGLARLFKVNVLKRFFQ
jgi:hypothetical protein